jgi:hypothetical protein
VTYPGLIDSIKVKGGNTSRQDRRWESEYYSWDPFVDLDKFINFSQYYWLPGGPDSVDVGSTTIPLTDAWEITRTAAGYEFSDEADRNPVITLVRGGNYTFQVNQPGFGFWIQAAPGVAGTMPATPNISSRDVLGVINNGEDQGTVTFNVPLKTAQDFFYSLNDLGTVDLLTDLKFNQLNNVYVSTFLAANPDGIDGITNLNNRTVVFTNTTVDAEAGGWQINTQFDPELRTNFAVSGTAVNTAYQKFTNLPLTTVTGTGSGAVATVIVKANSATYSAVTIQVSLQNIGTAYNVGDTVKITGDLLGGTSPANDMTLVITSLSENGLLGSYDTTLFDQTTDITSQAQRYSVWQIQYVLDDDGNPYMQLNSVLAVPELSKFRIVFGAQWSSTQWYKNSSEIGRAHV